MGLLDTLEKRFGRFALPNVTIIIIVGQILCYLLLATHAIELETITLRAEPLLRGEIWRLLTFLLVPPMSHPIFIAFAWYLFYLMGSALERYWGVFRYNVFLLIAYLATVGVSFVTPSQPLTNAFLGGSVFLAFAFLYPEFELYLFFVLPVKMKWLALVTWIGYFLAFAFSGWATRLTVLASVTNFLLFFGRDILSRAKSARRRMAQRSTQFAQENKPLHCCTVCKATDRTHPDMEFRYCGQCKPVRCYCMDHIHEHEHIVKKTGSHKA